MIKVENIVFEYSPNNRALGGISLEIAQGECVAIVGRNGSGKSTLAKHFNALLLPTSGSVFVDSLNTADAESTLHIRQKVQMVFQNPDNQLVTTIVEEDVAFGPENLGVPPAEIRQRVDDALAAVGMSDYASFAPHTLSGGQKQRIAIAGTLAMQPQAIILDEATAMLDPRGQEEVLSSVLRLNREQGMSVILITHFMEEAARADRIIVLDKGKLVMDDAPRELFKRRDELKALGLGVPAMAELKGELTPLGVDLPDGIITIDEMADALCRYL